MHHDISAIGPGVHSAAQGLELAEEGASLTRAAKGGGWGPHQS